MGEQPHQIRNARFFTPPNLLSVLRVVMLLPSILVMERQADWGPLPVIATVGLALLTDAFDGLLARRQGWISDLGRVLDPLADKLYLGGLGIYLALERGLPWWLLGLLLARDLFLIAASAMLVRRYRIVFSPNVWGKLATVSLSVVVFAYFLEVNVVKPPLLAFTTAMLALSMVGYVRNATRFVRTGAEA